MEDPLIETRKENDMSIATTFLGSLIAVVAQISEPLKIAIKSTVKELHKKAQSTPNPYDDMCVKFLAALLGVDPEENETSPGGNGTGKQ